MQRARDRQPAAKSPPQLAPDLVGSILPSPLAVRPVREQRYGGFRGLKCHRHPVAGEGRDHAFGIAEPKAAEIDTRLHAERLASGGQPTPLTERAARNLPDGRVEVVLEGAEADVRSAVAALSGPEAPGTVTAVDVRDEAAQGSTGFTVG